MKDFTKEEYSHLRKFWLASDTKDSSLDWMWANWEEYLDKKHPVIPPFHFNEVMRVNDYRTGKDGDQELFITEISLIGAIRKIH